MDECLPLGSLGAAALRMPLEKERSQREELVQEVRRLQAGLARQNERILALERENAALRQLVADQKQMIAGLQEQNALLRQQVAELQAENARLTGTVRVPKREPGAWPSERTQQEREPKPRKRREEQFNRGRQRVASADQEVLHAVESCPRCGRQLVGGWEHRRLQVIEAPEPAPVVVTDHVLVRRRCPACRLQVLPPLPVTGRVGTCRFGPRLLAQIAAMAIVERLPLRQIQRRLASQYQLRLSTGGMSGLLRQVSRQRAGTYAFLQADVRASPVVHADETGWREDGVPGYVWTVTTARTCLFHRDPHRSGAVIDTLLGEDFGGILVSDFYAAYDVRPVLPARTSVRMAVGKASSGSPTMTTIHSMEVQSLPLMVNGGTARPRG